jgi:hypothetical protein
MDIPPEEFGNPTNSAGKGRPKRRKSLESHVDLPLKKANTSKRRRITRVSPYPLIFESFQLKQIAQVYE